MAVKLGEAVVYLLGNKEGVEDSLKDSEKKTESWAKSLSSKVSGFVGGAIKVGLAGVAAGIVGLGTAAFAAGMEMDEAMDTISISTGKTGDDLKGLGKDFKAVFSSIPTDAGPAADAIAELNKRTGMTGEMLQETAKPLLEMTRLLGGDAKTNAQLFTRVMGDWSIKNEDAQGTLDKLFKASQLTGVGVEGLMQKVVAFGSPLRLMGFSLEESVAMFGKWEKEGVNAELVMGSLKIAAAKFAEAGVPLQQGLQDTITKIQGMEDASAALAMGMDVFGARAGPDMVAAIREGRFEIGDLVKELGNAKGAITQTADATADFPEKFKVFKNIISTSLAPLGIALMNILTMLAERFGPVLQSLTPFIEPLVKGLIGLVDTLIMGAEPLGDWGTWGEYLAEVFGADLATAIINAVTWIQTLATSIAGFVTGTLIPFIQENGVPILVGLATALLTVVVPAFVSWAIAAGTAAAATIAAIAPVAAPVLAIAAVAALLYKAWTGNWGGIQEKTQAVVTWIRNAIQAFLNLLEKWWDEHGAEVMETVTVMWTFLQNAWNAAITFISNAVQAFLAALRRWWDEHGAAVMALVQTMWEIVQNIFTTVTGVIERLFLAFLALIRGDWEAFGNYLKEAWTIFWNGIKTHFELVWSAIQQYIGIVWGEIRTLFDTALEALKTLLSNAWQAISEALTNAWNAIKTYFSETWQALGETFNTALEGLKTLLGNAWQAISEALTIAWNAVKTYFSETWTTLGTTFNTALEGLKTLLSNAWGAIQYATVGVWGDIFGFLSGWATNLWENAFRGPFNTLWEKFTEFWTNIRNWWTNLFDNIHIKTPHFNIRWQEVFGVQIPVGVDVSWYGRGGEFIVNGPLLIGVGEAGPERVSIEPLGARGGEDEGKGGTVDMDTTNVLLAQILGNMRALVMGIQALQTASVVDARTLGRQLEFEARMR